VHCFGSVYKQLIYQLLMVQHHKEQVGHNANATAKMILKKLEKGKPFAKLCLLCFIPTLLETSWKAVKLLCGFPIRRILLGHIVCGILIYTEMGISADKEKRQCCLFVIVFSSLLSAVT